MPFGSTMAQSSSPIALQLDLVREISAQWIQEYNEERPTNRRKFFFETVSLTGKLTQEQLANFPLREHNAPERSGSRRGLGWMNRRIGWNMCA